MNSIVEKEKSKTLKFAEKYGLSKAMVETEIENMYNSLKPDDFASDDERMIRAIRRSRGAFRRKAQQLAKAQEGMIVFRGQDYDWDRRQYNQAMAEEAKNGRDEAIKKGLMNKEGQPIYQYGQDKGKVIKSPSANGNAVGYFCVIDNKTKKEVIQPKFIAINDRLVEDNIPVCQIGQIAGAKGKSSNKDFPYSKDKTVWYKASTIDDDHKAPYSKEELSVILTDWDKAFGEKIPKLTSFEELLDYGEEHCRRKSKDEHLYDFCFIPGIISSIDKPETEYENIRVNIEFTDYESDEIHYISVYLPPGHLKGLSMEEGSAGICVLQAYNFTSDVDDPYWHLGGFLNARDDVSVEEFFGVSNE